MILSIILIIFVGNFLFKIYGFFPAIFGMWFSVIFMGYGIQPANSEMLGVNMCLLASAITFWNFYLYHKTRERKYFIRGIISSMFALNFHTFWGFILNLCTFLGFLSLDLIKAFKTISFNEALKILILFIVLTFPLFISISLGGMSHTKYYDISFDVFKNIKVIYHHFVLFSLRQFVSIFSLLLFLFAGMIFLFSIRYREKIENRSPFLSFFSFLLLIILVLAFSSDYTSIRSTDLFLRAVKYINFYTPFLLSSVISFLLTIIRIEKQVMKLALKIIAIVILSLLIYHIFNPTRVEEDKNVNGGLNEIEDAIKENLKNLVGESFISLQDQRELVNYLLENKIYNLYAIVPPISATEFIDILSKDKIKA